MKFIQLINVKMPTIVGILIFMSRINTTSESLKARKILFFNIFSFYQLFNKISCSVELSMKIYYNLGAWFHHLGQYINVLTGHIQIDSGLGHYKSK